ncbi:MAG: Mth938-like domain-containing protein [Pseudomonadota bacterium]
MKFQPDRIANANVVSGYTRHSVQVGEQAWRESFLLPWQGQIQRWDGARFDSLGAAHFEAVAALGPELVLFGSGARLRFPRPEWLRPLIERRIGFETMDTPAACRTYNLLVAEGRSVVAALLIDPPA